MNAAALALLRCPRTGAPLTVADGALVAGRRRYPVSPSGIPLFAEQPERPDSQAQRDHYDHVHRAYLANLERLARQPALPA